MLRRGGVQFLYQANYQHQTTMKRFFGSPLLRLIRGGVVLHRAEYQIISVMVAELPEHVQRVVVRQFNEYTVVQREADGRALNFYKMGYFSSKPVQTSATLQGKAGEADLISVSALTPGQSEALHATLNVIGGRVFQVSFSRPVFDLKDGQALKMTKFTHAWHKNFTQADA